MQLQRNERCTESSPESQGYRRPESSNGVESVPARTSDHECGDALAIHRLFEDNVLHEVFRLRGDSLPSWTHGRLDEPNTARVGVGRWCGALAAWLSGIPCVSRITQFGDCILDRDPPRIGMRFATQDCTVGKCLCRSQSNSNCYQCKEFNSEPFQATVTPIAEQSDKNTQHCDHNDHGSGRDLSQGSNGPSPKGCMPDG